MRTFVDRSVTRFDEVFASGGSEDTLLRIKVNELLRLGGVAGGCFEMTCQEQGGVSLFEI